MPLCFLRYSQSPALRFRSEECENVLSPINLQRGFTEGTGVMFKYIKGCPKAEKENCLPLVEEPKSVGGGVAMMLYIRHAFPSFL